MSPLFYVPFVLPGGHGTGLQAEAVFVVEGDDVRLADALFGSVDEPFLPDMGKDAPFVVGFDREAGAFAVIGSGSGRGRRSHLMNHFEWI